MPYLECSNGPGVGQKWEFNSKNSLKIGRDKTNEVALDDKLLSRHHCTILLIQDKVVIQDAQSTNGIFFNGERITRKIIDYNQKFEVGRCSFLVRPGDITSAKQVEKKPEYVTNTSPLIKKLHEQIKQNAVPLNTPPPTVVQERNEPGGFFAKLKRKFQAE